MMWTIEEIAVEMSRIERRAFERVRERCAKEQLGLAFIDLPMVTTQPTNREERKKVGRPREYDNGKRVTLRAVYDSNGATAAIQAAARLQITTLEARKLVNEWEAERGQAKEPE